MKSSFANDCIKVTKLLNELNDNIINDSVEAMRIDGTNEKKSELVIDLFRRSMLVDKLTETIEPFMRLPTMGGAED